MAPTDPMGAAVPLDPVIASVLDMMAANGAPAMSTGTPEQAREGFRQMTVGLRDPATLAEVASAEDGTVDGAVGQIRSRTYRPTVSGNCPTLLFIHGGGFVIGDLDTHDDHARRLCHDVGAVVVSIDYRLAPEAPFPAGYDDCAAAYRWLVAHVSELGGDPQRLAVAGDSAGGNLAAAVAIVARDEALPLAAQLLLYPAVDFAESDAYASRAQNAEGFFLTSDDMRWFGDNYLPDPSAAGDVRASVLRTPSLEGVAPAIVATAEYDPLRDEGEAYGKALADAGVQVVSHRYDGLIHGFFGLGPISPACAAAVTELCADLKGLLAG